MPSTYLPRREPDLDAWIGNFNAKIAADPVPYGLTDSDAVELTAAVNAFHAAYLTATAPATRTRAAVLAKNEAKRAALRTVRRFAAAVRVNPTVANELKIGLGLHVGGGVDGSSIGTSIHAPATAPWISPTGITLGGHILRITDTATPSRRAKPPGAAGLMLFRIVADEPIMRPEHAELLAMLTRNRYESRFSKAQHGQTATYFARWVSPRGEFGPWSAPASLPIAA